MNQTNQSNCTPLYIYFITWAWRSIFYSLGQLLVHKHGTVPLIGLITSSGKYPFRAYSGRRISASVFRFRPPKWTPRPRPKPTEPDFLAVTKTEILAHEYALNFETGHPDLLSETAPSDSSRSASCTILATSHVETLSRSKLIQPITGM